MPHLTVDNLEIYNFILIESSDEFSFVSLMPQIFILLLKLRKIPNASNETSPLTPLLQGEGNLSF